jgi:hypothetical protein
MIETFEAVIFGLRNGSWTIIERHPVAELSEGLEWARKGLIRAQPLAYERLSARVISSSDDETVESVMQHLGKRAGSGMPAECYHHKHRARKLAVWAQH